MFHLGSTFCIIYIGSRFCFIWDILANLVSFDFMTQSGFSSIMNISQKLKTLHVDISKELALLLK